MLASSLKTKETVRFFIIDIQHSNKKHFYEYNDLFKDTENSLYS